MRYSIIDQIKTVKREVHRRKKFFPYLVKNGKLTEGEAMLERDKMKCVLETLTQLKGLVETQ